MARELAQHLTRRGGKLLPRVLGAVWPQSVVSCVVSTDNTTEKRVKCDVCRQATGKDWLWTLYGPGTCRTPWWERRKTTDSAGNPLASHRAPEKGHISLGRSQIVEEEGGFRRGAAYFVGEGLVTVGRGPGRLGSSREGFQSSEEGLGTSGEGLQSIVGEGLASSCVSKITPPNIRRFPPKDVNYPQFGVSGAPGTPK